MTTVTTSVGQPSTKEATVCAAAVSKLRMLAAVGVSSGATSKQAQ
jgi:hypothetical protein